ncbi:MAG: hypothetical protein GDA40_05895 [Rhodobacteraceae bacterium]|nr:hypothetical protein [Paracoccaceae bacterium]
MKHRISLDYDLAEGWLAPWTQGLRKGEAVASRCSACGTARFPPLRRCPDCRVPSDGWVTLSGRATVVWRTTGADGDFVLAQFEGADGAAVLCADHLPRDAAMGRLRASGDGPLALELEAEQTK